MAGKPSMCRMRPQEFFVFQTAIGDVWNTGQITYVLNNSDTGSGVASEGRASRGGFEYKGSTGQTVAV